MSLPPQHPEGAAPAAETPPGQSGQPGWPVVDTGTPEWAPPAWTAPAWTPPAAPAPVPAQPAAPSRRKGPLVLALVAVVGVLAGAVGSAFLVTAAFISAAEDIGREMSDGLGSDIGRSVGEGLTQSMEDAFAGMAPEGAYTWSAEGPGTGPVEEFPPVEPGVLGPDPVLDAYAQSCFTGDLQACDDLWFESPPMSDYEDYAGTCGGRVKLDAVVACTDLE